MLNLNNLTEENIEAVLALRMDGWQADKFPSVAEEISRAYVAPTHRIPLVITFKEEVVGFMVFVLPPLGDTIDIVYFMISWQHQNKGYGVQALRLFTEYAESFTQIKLIRKVVSTGDLIGRKALESAGFMRKQTDLSKRETEMLYIIR